MSTIVTTIDPERQMLEEVEMVGRERWEEIHRRASSGASIRVIAGALDLDRKTVRRCLRQTAWTPYERAARSDTLLTTHAEYLRRRPPSINGPKYSHGVPACSRKILSENVLLSALRLDLAPLHPIYS